MSKAIDVKSMLIGLLLATSVMLFMGADEQSEWNVDGKVIIEANENGRYQMHMGEVLVDTQTGEVYEIRESSDGYYFKKVTKN